MKSLKVWSTLVTLLVTYTKWPVTGVSTSFSTLVTLPQAGVLGVGPGLALGRPNIITISY